MFPTIHKCIVVGALILGSWGGTAVARAEQAGRSPPKSAVPAAAPRGPSFAAFLGGASRGKVQQQGSHNKSAAGGWMLTRNNTLMMWLPGGVLLRAEPAGVDRASHTLITRVIVVETLGLVDKPQSWQVVGGGQMDFSLTGDGGIQAISQMSWGMVKDKVIKGKGRPVRWDIIPD